MKQICFFSSDKLPVEQDFEVTSLKTNSNLIRVKGNQLGYFFPNVSELIVVEKFRTKNLVFNQKNFANFLNLKSLSFFSGCRYGRVVFPKLPSQLKKFHFRYQFELDHLAEDTEGCSSFLLDEIKNVEELELFCCGLTTNQKNQIEKNVNLKKLSANYIFLVDKKVFRYSSDNANSKNIKWKESESWDYDEENPFEFHLKANSVMVQSNKHEQPGVIFKGKALNRNEDYSGYQLDFECDENLWTSIAHDKKIKTKKEVNIKNEINIESDSENSEKSEIAFESETEVANFFMINSV